MNSLSQRGDRKSFDVVVIGSGLAGLTFCLTLIARRPHTRIALVSKQALSDSNSYWAQGGIAAAAGVDDSVQQHLVDTLAAGDGLVSPLAAKAILSQSLSYIAFLQQQGVVFDQNDQSLPDLAKEGGHSKRRIFHAGDHTGRAMIDALIPHIQQQSNIYLFESHMAVKLLRQKDRPSEDISGVYVLDTKSGLIDTFLCNVVVLATGGAGKTYRYTTNPDIATGDGVAMAYRAGVPISNMEFYQFHPTLLYQRNYPNFLISEAIRGEGAYLRLPETGERFMRRYAPKQMELATRDIVARAIFTETEHSNDQYVYLDITHKSKAFLKQHFPTINDTLMRLGIDMSQDMIPVVPAAHYMCGGVLTDISGRTQANRLYAIGEVACTGLHGANRLASNSLLEAGVMATNAAEDCLVWLDQPLSHEQMSAGWDSGGVTDLRRASQINAHWRGLRGEMTSYAGIVRTEAGLKDLHQLILLRQQMVEEYYWQHVVTQDLLELRNIILVAELIVRSALQRCESRGGHYREDYPNKADNTKRTLLRQAPR
ncbi:MAG: L-aspartate oxidase [Gammaproteobacteria bacterium]|jgi:L-aspartate oxidase|nr:L-aspartate oxidase [Gammaproteobacteria bacterium]